MAGALWAGSAVARADYELSIQHTPSSSGTLALGAMFDLDVVLSGSPFDAHNSAIFRVAFSQPGLVYTGYRWEPPYAPSGGDDDSKPRLPMLPTTLTASTLAGPSYPVGVIDFELSNVTADSGGQTQLFTQGKLVTLSFQVPNTLPIDPQVGISFKVSVIPDTFARGFSLVPTTGGAPIAVQVLPEPGSWALCAGGALVGFGVWRRLRRGRAAV